MHPHGRSERPIVAAAIAAVCVLGCLASISPIANLIISAAVIAALIGATGTGAWLLISLTGHRDHRPRSERKQLAAVERVMTQPRQPLIGRR